MINRGFLNHYGNVFPNGIGSATGSHLCRAGRNNFKNLRAMEIKHGRIAMLATVGSVFGRQIGWGSGSQEANDFNVPDKESEGVCLGHIMHVDSRRSVFLSFFGSIYYRGAYMECTRGRTSLIMQARDIIIRSYVIQIMICIVHVWTPLSDMRLSPELNNRPFSNDSRLFSTLFTDQTFQSLDSQVNIYLLEFPRWRFVWMLLWEDNSTQDVQKELCQVKMKVDGNTSMSYLFFFSYVILKNMWVGTFDIHFPSLSSVQIELRPAMVFGLICDGKLFFFCFPASSSQ